MIATALTPQEQLQATLSDAKILDALNQAAGPGGSTRNWRRRTGWIYPARRRDHG